MAASTPARAPGEDSGEPRPRPGAARRVREGWAGLVPNSFLLLLVRHLLLLAWHLFLLANLVSRADRRFGGRGGRWRSTEVILRSVSRKSNRFWQIPEAPSAAMGGSCRPRLQIPCPRIRGWWSNMVKHQISWSQGFKHRSRGQAPRPDI